MSARPLRLLTLLSAVLVVGELISAVIIAAEHYHDAQPVFAVVFAVLFGIGFWLLRSGRVGLGNVVVGVLCLFEIVSFPGWQRHNALDWVFQSVYALVALAGLVSAVALFVSRRRAPAVTA